MAYSITYYKESDLVYIQFQHDVNLKDQYSIIDEILNSDYFSPTLNVIEDLRYARLIYSVDDQDFIFNKLREVLPRLNWIRVGILVAGPVQTAYAKLFEILTKGVRQLDCKVFSTEEGARDWIKIKRFNNSKNSKKNRLEAN